MKEKVLEAFRELGFTVGDFGDDYIIFADQQVLIYSSGDNEEKCLSLTCFVPYNCKGFNIFQRYTLSEKLNASLRCIKAYMNGNVTCLVYERCLLWDDEDLKSVISDAIAILHEECEAALEILGDIEELMTDENGESLTLGEQLDGHECVDLGLSVKWAMCNVGAVTPLNSGGFYAWGETDIKNVYTPTNSKTSGKELENIAGDPTHDVARAKWGGCWRLPTEEEVEELVKKCAWTWTKMGGVYGYKVTSRTNGNSIFLPAAGCSGESCYIGSGNSGVYWSATPTDRNHAGAIFFQSPSLHIYALAGRFWGGSVRAVSEL